MPARYRDHDVFVSPTYAEGFSNTILEAMASGQAVLSCRAVGVTDCIRDGENGLLVELVDIAEREEWVEQYGLSIPVLRRCDSWAELGWPFDSDQIVAFLR